MGIGGGLPFSGRGGLPTVGEYEAGTPEAGFLFPAFSNRSTDLDGVNIFAADENCEKLANMLGL